MSIRDMILFRGIKGVFSRYFITRKSFGFIDKSSTVTPPVTILGEGIYISENVSIGTDSLMYATHAKIHIKKGFVAAKGLKLISGGHERRVGMFLYSISEHDKDLSLNLYRDIVIQ